LKVADPLDLSPETFQAFASLITSELGIQMPEKKQTMLRSRLLRRIRNLGLGGMGAYRDLIFSEKGESERIHFIDAVTTNKTDFFREAGHFEYMRTRALPLMERALIRKRKSMMCGWCAGCSSGEEVYTLSMVLSEFLQGRTDLDYSLYATDISTRVLAQARKAVYPESRIEPVSQKMRKQYLLRSKDRSKQEIRIVPRLRAKVNFQRLNFMEDHYEPGLVFDFIFFRNVMIYFDRPTQEAVVNKLCRHLEAGGFLFVGHSESLSGLRVPVTQVADSVFRMPGTR